MSKKITRKVLVAVFALVLSVVALGTTTYAWFTLGNQASVSEFEMSVTGGEGLEVAYVDKDGDVKPFVTTLLKGDIRKYLESDYGFDEGTWLEAFELAGVTSEDGKAFKKLSDDGTSLVDLETNEKPYVEFKLKFRTKAAGKNLIWASIDMNSEGVEWTPQVPFTGIDGENTTESDTYYAVNSARVSIENEAGDVVVHEKGEATDNKVLSSSEPNWTQGAHDFYNKVTGVDLSEHHASHRAVETEQVAGKDLGAFSTGADSDGYYYANITVRVYLEGFDSEMFNAVFEDILKVGLKFKLPEE